MATLRELRLPPEPGRAPSHEEDRAIKIEDPAGKWSDKIIVSNAQQLHAWILELEETLEQEGVEVAPFPAEGRTPTPWSGTKPQRERQEQIDWLRFSRLKPGINARHQLQKASTVKYLEGRQHGTNIDELVGILRVLQMALHDSTNFFICMYLDAPKGHLVVHFFMTFSGNNGAKVSRVFRILYRSTCAHRSTDINDMLTHILCPHVADCTCGRQGCMHACTMPACTRCADQFSMRRQIEEQYGSMENYLRATHKYGALFVKLGMIPFGGIHHFIDDGSMAQALKAPLRNGLKMGRLLNDLKTGEVLKMAKLVTFADLRKFDPLTDRNLAKSVGIIHCEKKGDEIKAIHSKILKMLLQAKEELPPLTELSSPTSGSKGKEGEDQVEGFLMQHSLWVRKPEKHVADAFVRRLPLVLVRHDVPG